MADRDKFSADTGVPVEAIGYSDFIEGGIWEEVDEVLRGVYQEASEVLGQEFTYPKDKE